jgi:DNA-binding MarR family transcriptional regulator
MMNEPIRALVDVDRVVHEPARLALLALLRSIGGADFLFLQRETGLTKGNLSSHLSRLETAGYVEIEKTFEGKIPRTLVRSTDDGRRAFDRHCQALLAVIESGN